MRNFIKLESTEHNHGTETKAIVIHYPSCIRRVGERALLADHINQWVRQFVANHPVPGWKDLYDGIDMFHVSGNTYSLYVPELTNTETLNSMQQELNIQFAKKWNI